MTTPFGLLLIARNEIDNLASGFHEPFRAVKQFVVVDTGSTDDTVAVARSLGATVIHHVWDDDFSAARNAGLAHLTTPWVMWLDADERLDADNLARLAALLGTLRDNDCRCFTFRQRSAVADQLGATVVDQVRLFRRVPGVRWEYRVHEQILPSLRRAGMVPAATDIVVEHHGYADAATLRAKKARNRRLLDRQLAEMPEDGFTHYNLGVALLDDGDPFAGRV